MIQDGHLSDFIWMSVETKSDLSQVRTSRGDFSVKELSLKTNDVERNELIVQSWKKVSAEYLNTTPSEMMQNLKPRLSTLIFAVDIEHVESLANHFQKHDINAMFIHSKTPKNDRKTILDAFKSGEIPVLINCGILTEGTDIPNIDCISMFFLIIDSFIYTS